MSNGSAWARNYHSCPFCKLLCVSFRTPQGFRALARCYVTLFIPIFFGPYYANLRLGIGTPFAVVFAIVVRYRPP